MGRWLARMSASHKGGIDPSVLGEDVDMVQDLVVAAVNNALDKSRELSQERMGSLMPPGMMPPGFPGL